MLKSKDKYGISKSLLIHKGIIDLLDCTLLTLFIRHYSIIHVAVSQLKSRKLVVYAQNQY